MDIGEAGFLVAFVAALAGFFLAGFRLLRGPPVDRRPTMPVQDTTRELEELSELEEQSEEQREAYRRTAHISDPDERSKAIADMLRSRR